MYERQEFSKDGVCHLVYEYSLPSLPEGKAGHRIEKFLHAICGEVQKSAEVALPRLAEDYESDPDPKKRFRHRSLSLKLSFSLTEKGGTLFLTEHLSLSRGGRTLSEKESAMRFDKQSGYLLPGRKGKSKKRKHCPSK